MAKKEDKKAQQDAEDRQKEKMPETVEEKTETSAEEVQSQIEELNDKLMRTMAEYDNFRKRTVKEKESLYTSVAADTAAKFLPVLDNLERAAMAAAEASDVKPVAEGIDMVLKQLKEAFASVDVEEIPAEGEAFDPEFHNAVMHIEEDGVADNTIVEVFQKGYKLKDKVLRHSMVKVCN